MKKAVCLAAVFLALAFGSCVKKADVQADSEAIKALLEGYETSLRTPDVEWIVSKYYADGVLRLLPNQPPLEGSEALRTAWQAAFDQVNYEKAELVVKDVKVSGDLAVARGTGEWTTVAKTGGETSEGKAKWVAVYQRQPDGSWRCSYDIVNSDEPAPGTSAGGIEEKALIQMEREWAEAEMKADTAAIDKIMAAGWTNIEDGQVIKKAQVLADLRSGATKVESVVVDDLKTAVYGDMATVYGLWTSKSSQKGKDTSGQFRFADVFKKIEGRWQAVATYSTKVQ